MKKSIKDFMWGALYYLLFVIAGILLLRWLSCFGVSPEDAFARGDDVCLFLMGF